MMLLTGATEGDASSLSNSKESSPAPSLNQPRRKLSMRHVYDRVQKYLSTGTVTKCQNLINNRN